ncbi:SDR family oxidoreductase [Amycolatopsis benzoatilytica]|uniref:SDR family oxidoreductase n=1 Tax=Amycolatopsis benzoatilytica TaxID=346045 RepID=UPI00035E90EB|nr:SDR family oxidoreductase [Amycolatopsis benzoatilytica]
MSAPSSAARHWFVTGASGGLGRHLVGEALRRGEYVTATVRRPDALRDLAAAFGAQLTVERLDLLNPEDVTAVIGRVQRNRPVDVVVNNAGYAVVGAAEEMTAAQIRDQLEVLLIAPILITKAFLAPMRARGGGRIIQISSLGGQIGAPTHSAYHAAKWGLEGYSESVAREVAEFGIHLTIAQPGATRTGFAAALQYTTETGPYRDNPVGRMRRYLESIEDSELTGDPAKIAAVLYETTLRPDPPLRLALGPDTYEIVHAALTNRLGQLEAQRDVAESVVF